jgi:hypothetical protein
VRLLEDRELVLFDGTRYMSQDKLAKLSKKLRLTEAELAARNVHPIHQIIQIRR